MHARALERTVCSKRYAVGWLPFLTLSHFSLKVGFFMMSTLLLSKYISAAERIQCDHH